jgi:hypothetical protein
VRTLALDPVTRDLVVVAGRLQVVSGADAVAQRLRVRLRLGLGEWHRNRRVGVPFRRFLGQKGAEDVAEAVLRQAIASCPGVASLDAFEIVLDDRHARVTFTVTTVDEAVIGLVEVRDFIVSGAEAA